MGDERIMGRIRILDEFVANRIAAGEVVERPSNVVKELVENAIDADATRIDVLVEAGGNDLVVCQDNGIGMSDEDLKLAVLRHATSKIESASDLQRISTLGFRGEALPSIASVSRLEIVSRPAGEELGYRIVVSRGEIIEQGSAGAPIGTKVEVRELFFDTPARRKFLKSAITEFGYVADVVERIATAYPRVAFTLKHGDKLHLDLPKVDTYLARLEGIWGERAEEMLEIEAGDSGIAVFGFSAPPSINWGSPENIRFVVNGRPITNKTLLGAVKKAYEGTLPPGRYPQVVLFIEMSPELIDVNVHPMKLEVRFRRGDDIFGSIVRAVRNALGADVSKTFDFPQKTRAPFSFRKEDILPAPKLDFARTSDTRDWDTISSVFTQKPLTALTVEDTVEKVSATFWQAHKTYIITETKGGLIIVDQHAAHERILFEEIKNRLARGHSLGQRLLFPLGLRLDGKQESALHENKKSLEKLGFAFGPSVPGHVLIEAVPQELSNFGEGEAFLEILNELFEGGGTRNTIDSFAAMAACHMAIKAGDPLNQEEMAFLFDRLFATSSPYTCPHGRPTIFKMSINELEKKFERK